MRVEWKIGITTEVDIHYSKMTDEPYPKITKETVERKTLTKGTIMVEAYVVNGVPVFAGCPAIQAESVKRAQAEVMDLVIMEPKSYEPPIPRVYGMRTKSESGGAEYEAVHKAAEKTTNHAANTARQKKKAEEA